MGNVKNFNVKEKVIKPPAKPEASLVWPFSTCINMEDSRIGGDFYIKGTSLYVLFRDEVG
jgi:hypothetical protein